MAGDLPTLIWAANLADLEIHTPMWRLPRIAEPDLLVFDLDPGAPANLADCCRVALLLRPLLEQVGLHPLAKTSGGKGMQLYAALSGMTSEQASDLARALAEHLEQAHPGLIVSRMTKALRPGKVLIDWSQNNAANDHRRALLVACHDPAHRVRSGHLGRGRRLQATRRHRVHQRRGP